MREPGYYSPPSWGRRYVLVQCPHCPEEYELDQGNTTPCPRCSDKGLGGEEE